MLFVIFFFKLIFVFFFLVHVRRAQPEGGFLERRVPIIQLRLFFSLVFATVSTVREFWQNFNINIDRQWRIQRTGQQYSIIIIIFFVLFFYLFFKMKAKVFCSSGLIACGTNRTTTLSHVFCFISSCFARSVDRLCFFFIFFFFFFISLQVASSAENSRDIERKIKITWTIFKFLTSAHVAREFLTQFFFFFFAK